MKTLAVANNKGGVGKTTTAHTLGAYFALGGTRVLLIDLDPQASLTNACGAKPKPGANIAAVLGGAQPGKKRLRDVTVTAGECLDLVPAHAELLDCETQMQTRMRREEILASMLKRGAGDYELIIIDCPPARGLLTLNALTAADGVMCPTQAEMSAVLGLAQFAGVIREVQQMLNPALRMVGIVPTFYNARTVHHREIVEQMKARRWPVTEAIPRSIRVAEAPVTYDTVLTYAPENPAAARYAALGERVGQWVAN